MEKKSIKISLSTAILSIIIIALIGLIVYFALVNSNLKAEHAKEEEKNVQLEVNEIELSKQNIIEEYNEEISSETDSEQDKSLNDSNQSNVKNNLIQFDTGFYNLKTASMEYRECQKIKNYKDFEYDLDGDGIKDKITIKNIGKDEHGNVEDLYKIYLNGNEFYQTDAYCQYEVYIVDLNQNDKTTEVIIHILASDDLECYNVYSKSGTKMKEVKKLDYGWELLVDKKGKLVLDNALLSCINPKIYKVYYEFNKGVIQEKKANTEILKNITFKTNDMICFTQDKDCIKKFVNSYSSESDDDLEENRYSKYGIYKDEKYEFKFIKFTDDFINGSIYCKLKDGREGYLFSFAYNLAG